MPPPSYAGYYILADVEQLPDGLPTPILSYMSKTTVTANPTTDVITAAINHDLVLDEFVFFTTTGTLPAPLTPYQTYRVLSVSLTPTQITISVNPESQGGTPIDITDSGVGTHTIWTRPFDMSFPGSSVNTTTDVVTTPSAHFLHLGGSVNDRIRFSSTGTLPVPLIANTDYWPAPSPGLTTFKVTASVGGSVIDLTTAGTGTLTVSAIRGSSAADFHQGKVGAYNLQSAYMISNVGNIIIGGGGGIKAGGAEGDPLVIEVPRPTIKVRDPELASLIRRARRAARIMENLTIVGASGNPEDGFSL